MTDSAPDPYNELGRRLFAAVLSCELGLRGMDYTLREYVPEVVEPCWCELAEDLMRHRQESAMDVLFGQPGGTPQLVVDNRAHNNKPEPF